MKKGSAEIIVALIVAVIIMLTAISQQPKSDLFDSGFCNEAIDCNNQVLNKSSCPGSFSCEQNKCSWKCNTGFNTVECNSDSNCITAGCSSELCVPSYKAGEIVSICLYKDEYACLKKTTCSCIAGKCEWKYNLEYKSCLENPQISRT